MNKIILAIIAIIVINVIVSQKVGVDPSSWAGIKMFGGTALSIVAYMTLSFYFHLPQKLALPALFLLLFCSWIPIFDEWTLIALKASQDNNTLDNAPSLPWYANGFWRFVSIFAAPVAGWFAGDLFD